VEEVEGAEQVAPREMQYSFASNMALIPPSEVPRMPLTETSGDRGRTRSSGTRGGRVERSFSRLGIVAASLLIVAAVLAIDMALTREVRLLGTGEIEKEPSFAALETGRSIMRNSTLLSGLYRVLRG
jgi:hypothetical protein